METNGESAQMGHGHLPAVVYHGFVALFFFDNAAWVMIWSLFSFPFHSLCYSMIRIDIHALSE
jgi:hypothetical protein